MPSLSASRVAIGAALVLLLSESPAAAAESVEDTVTVLPPVEVSTERSLVPGRETATSVKLNRSNVTRFLPLHSADALLALPGVDLIKTGPWASRISVRGISGERVLVMVDGVRVNTVRGHGAQGSSVSTDRLEAVELLPGASSAQFGSDAMGGVVNLVTHRNLFRSTPRLGMTFMVNGAGPGNSWKQTGRLRWSTPRLGLEASGGIGAFDALVTPTGPIPNSSDRTDEYSLRGTALLSGTLFDVEHTRESAHDVGLPAFNGAAGAAGHYPLQRRTLNRLEISRPGAGYNPAVSVLAYHQRFLTDFGETTVDSSFVRGRFVGTRTNTKNDHVETPVWSVRPELRFVSAGLTLAAEVRREETMGPRAENAQVHNAAGQLVSNTNSSSESVPPASRDVLGLSAFAAQEVFRTRFEAGVRYDELYSHADSTATSSTSVLDVTDSRWSFEGGIAHRLGPIEPYVHAATGFRAPNLQERYYHADIHGGLLLFGNQDLVAEQSKSWEAGVRMGRAAGGFQALRISAYRTDVDDLITFAYIGQLYLIPRFQYVNLNRGRLEGLELSASMRSGPVGLDLNATLPRGIDLDTGEELLDAGTSRVTVDLSTSIHRVLPLGRAAFRLRWNDAVTSADPAFARPAFTTGAVEVSTVLGSTLATFAVTNLWDLSYREPLSFIDEPGRTFSIALRRDFDFGIGGQRNPG